jgi:hypothetical protein
MKWNETSIPTKIHRKQSCFPNQIHSSTHFYVYLSSIANQRRVDNAVRKKDSLIKILRNLFIYWHLKHKSCGRKVMNSSIQQKGLTDIYFESF